MKKILFFVALFAPALACHKALRDVNDYFPQVRTVSAVVQTDGTVLVEGEIISEGASPIEYLGFCCSTSTEPLLLDRQALGNYANGKFRAVYSGFDPDSVYYFRSWATNEYGYAYGDILSLGNIIPATVTPPCNLTQNTCSLYVGQSISTYDAVTAPDVSLGQWKITATCFSGPTVTFNFGSELKTGIFHTSNDAFPSSGNVYVSFYDGQLSGFLKPGSEVYVNRVSSGVYDIAICNAPWNFVGTDVYFNTRLTSPL